MSGALSGPGSGRGTEVARVVLIGAPGSGKSAVGVRLAEALGVHHHDVDTLVEERTGLSIGDIFATEGEAWFRALEAEVTAEVLDWDGVVSLGGGAPLTASVRDALTGQTVVWLQVSAGVAADRVGLNVARPLLLGNVRGRLLALLKERTPVYAAAATHTVDTDGQSPEQVVTAVLASLGGPASGSGGPGSPGSGTPGTGGAGTS